LLSVILESGREDFRSAAFEELRAREGTITTTMHAMRGDKPR